MERKLEAYATLFVVSVLFTLIDLIVTSCQLPISSLIFSSLSMIVGFVGAYKSRVLTIEDKYNEAIRYINRNFNKVNIILSILDVLCCIIALMTGVFALMLIFRCSIALRVAIYINKYKSVAMGIWVIAFVHLFKRKDRRVIMTKNTTFQKVLASIIAVFGVGGVVVYFLPEFTHIAEYVTRSIAMFSEIIATLSGIWLANTHDHILTDEEIEDVKKSNAKKYAIKEVKREVKVKAKMDFDNMVAEKMKEQDAVVKQIQVAKEVE